MRLSEFIVQNVDRIVDEWEQFAATITPAAENMDSIELRDHAKAILIAASRDMNTAQTASEQQAKAEGESLEKTPSLDRASASHGELRHAVGFDLVQMTSEFRHLRACVIRLWVKSVDSPAHIHLQDMIRFNEAIDEALAESTAAYAEQVNRSRDIFLAILGHDLRAPLQAVSMSTEMLERKAKLDANALNYVAAIKNGARHMGAMVSDLLEFVRSRLGTGLPIERRVMNLGNACQSALEEACAGQPDCTPTLRVEGDVEGLWDPSRISQLLQNLIGNALQHGARQGEISLSVAGSADAVTLRVHNRGIPITEDAVGTLFDPLVRSPSEDPSLPGTSTSLGLGLFIVKEVVDAHHGQIDVTSTQAEGTTFTVVLPKNA
ncbi:HAMP domain-containing sensor histidine kinase [Pseudomonas sp. CCC3.1]|uniref:sensor histidine kinase n=1 Tax=Pseudomonas sp. CCC3.1 TaxID=3048607 RepID=UPI002AC9E765|nr:HAMP domain-containing sensor histidine kinase [Pseudomonas sp. CCC3.1]MEB0208154.1 HAMP domain-containing sensor histidine kinase [Pseudomonas sp. CCC3.1]WPX35618.1 HAMP domain-containing sensor histidine kinase [Pseudomonas sp. CCC3.1]